MDKAPPDYSPLGLYFLCWIPSFLPTAAAAQAIFSVFPEAGTAARNKKISNITQTLDNVKDKLGGKMQSEK